MPRVKIVTADGAEHEIRDMDAESVADLVDNFQTGDEPVLSFVYGEMGYLQRPHRGCE